MKSHLDCTVTFTVRVRDSELHLIFNWEEHNSEQVRKELARTETRRRAIVTVQVSYRVRSEPMVYKNQADHRFNHM